MVTLNPFFAMAYLLKLFPAIISEKMAAFVSINIGFNEKGALQGK
jgi:hypothetical protein